MYIGNTLCKPSLLRSNVTLTVIEVRDLGVTIDSHLTFYNHIKQTIARACMVMLDLSAAFDTVDHGMLINVLKRRFACRDAIKDWFHSYLSGGAVYAECLHCNTQFITLHASYLSHYYRVDSNNSVN